MLLTIDIGNTNIKLAVFEDARLLAQWRLQTERLRLADEYAVTIDSLFQMANLELRAVRGCAISCVVPPLTSQFRSLIRNLTGVEPLMLGPGVPTGMRYDVEEPNALGADRIANSVAAFDRYGGPVIAIGLGTATTFDVVNTAGDYIGGAIAPGIGISADALFRLAAKLYQVELVSPPQAIAKNTVHHLQSGLIFGYAGLIEGLVRRMRAELNVATCPVVATGGLAEIIAGQTDVITAVEPLLTLEGLRLIYQRNV